MKYLVAFTLCAFLAFPAFSQSVSSERARALGDSISNSLSRSTTKLAHFDSMIKDDGIVKMYTSYKREYESVLKALNDSEARLNLLIRTNDRHTLIEAERDNYEAIHNNLQKIKSDYDNFMRTVQ